ncbi:MAG: sensor histidine kinase [Bdellovibrionota bacterium]
MSKKQNGSNTQQTKTNYLEETRRFTHDLKAPLMILNSSFMKEAQYLPSEDLVRRSIERVYEMSREYLQSLQSMQNDEETPPLLESLSLIQLKNILRHKLATVPTLAAQKGLHCIPKLYNFVGLQKLIGENQKTDFVQLNSVALHRALDNIILNALEAMSPLKEQQSIVCTLLLEGSHVVIQIQDSGEGCDAETLRNIFTDNFQSKKVAGRGLGLRSARETLKKWGAHLEFVSTPKKGSVVTLTLPLHVGPQAHEIN